MALLIGFFGSNSWKVKDYLTLVVFFFICGSLTAQNVSFDLSALDFNEEDEINSGTSLQFGPDDRLYTVQLNGEIKIFTIEKTTANQYEVIASETLLGVKEIPNHDDNGNSAFDQRDKRQSTGIEVAGTADKPIIYVSSSDPKWGGPSGDKALDTNSGIISRLTWNGTAWEVVDLVRGLPRSEENHSTNGMQLVTIKGNPFLLVASGGLTNAGSPSKNFTYISEYALSGAILSIDLNAINALPTLVDQRSGRSYKYDLPTLDDPSRANSNGVYDPNDPNYNGQDVNDPFGGNDGLNMAMLVEGSPVQIFSSGFRNAYDLVVTESGKIYVTDNGANGNWGGLPKNEGNAALINNDYRDMEPGSSGIFSDEDGEYVDNKDHLLMITTDLESYTFGSFYGGHPSPLRANPGKSYKNGLPFPFTPGGAGLYTKFIEDDEGWANITPSFTPADTFRTQILKPIAPGQPGFDNYAATSLPVNWPPVASSLANAAEADFIAPTLPNPDGPQPEIITVWPNNTNGIDEYTASNFEGAIKGALIAGKNGGSLHFLEMNQDGSLKSIEYDKWNLNGGNALGITCNGDEDIFPGTIWVSTFDKRILILTPSDDIFCIAPDDPTFDPEADYDYDGYTNQDELDNGTDPCSGASRPNDYDEDKLSDLKDLDDDGDSIPDDLDAFQIGAPFDLPIDNELFSNQLDNQERQSGYLGLGLTGLMNNGTANPNWLDWLDKPDDGPTGNDVYGGTAGAIQVAMTGGTANGSNNNQEKGFQFGINVSKNTGPFTIKSGLMSLASPGQLYQYSGEGEIGIQIGDGTQSNFIKLVLTKTHIIAAKEINDVEDPNPLMTAIPIDERPTNAELVELSFNIDPATGEVSTLYQIGNNPAVLLGTIQASGNILDAIQQEGVPLAIGILGTSNDHSKEFIGGWDYFKVMGESPYILRPMSDIERILADPDLVMDLNQYFGDNGGAQNLTFSVIENTNSSIGALISGNSLTLQFPKDAVTSNITVRATDTNGFFVDQKFTVDVIESTTVLMRINAGGAKVAGTNDFPDWEGSPSAGFFEGTAFSVNSGKVAKFKFDPANRHASIPDYVDDTTYAQLFGSERYNSKDSMKFEIPLPEGKYLVNLYMGNGFVGTSTIMKRYFDISMEDSVVFRDVDLSGTYGHLVGAMQQYAVNLSDGILNIDFVKKKENPLINAIEIIGKPIQTPIEFTPFDNQFSMINQDLNSGLVVMASGGDGNLEFNAEGLPPGVFIEPTNGVIYGTVSEKALGSSPYLVTITIDDEDDISSDAVSFNFSWKITPVVADMFWSEKDEDEQYHDRYENSFVQAGDKFYLMGGREYSKDIDIYDYTTNTWTSLLNSAPHNFNHFQAVEYQGLIWVIGAFKTNEFPFEEPADYIWAFDPANQEWIQGPEIPESRRRGSAGLAVYEDKFYILGGNTVGHNGGYVNYFDEFDPATGTWTVLEDSPRPRDHFYATVIGNKLYAASGRLSGGTGGTFGPVIPEVDVYDFNTKTWSTLPPELNLPTPRAAAVVANYKEKLIVAGGEDPLSTSSFSLVEMYDPVLQRWSTISSLKQARNGAQGIVSGNGLYVVGGSPVRGSGTLKSMEFFGSDDPQGSPSLASRLVADSLVVLKKGVISPLDLHILDGNQGIIINSMQITGPDSLDFVLSSGEITKGLVSANSVHEINIEYIGTQLQSSAVLEIAYGNASVMEIQLLGDGVYEQVSLYLNSGSFSEVEWEGEMFAGDKDLNNYFNASNTYTNSLASSMPLFQSERNAYNLVYTIPVPNGIYTVKTYHNELWFGKAPGVEEGPGKRIFDIQLEGHLVKDNLDMFVENANQPLTLTYENVSVVDGKLDLALIASKNKASISGLAIINMGPLDTSPKALASASVKEGQAPLSVDFTGSDSQGGVSYFWDFGDGSTSTEPNPSHVFMLPGAYEITLTVEGLSGTSDTSKVDVNVLDGETTFFLNSGSAEDVVFEGESYLGDLNFGSYFSNSGTYSNSLASEVPLYATERNGKTLNYTIPLPNGTYTIRTHHNELWFGQKGPSAAAGNRVFDISIEGNLVKDNFDIFVENSNQPTQLNFEGIAVTDGVLNINMSASANNVSISGIAIESTSTKMSGNQGSRVASEGDKLNKVGDSNEERDGELKISLYPNPAKAAAILSINRDVQLKTILVHDMGGQLIHQFSPSEVMGEDGSFHLTLSDMPQGVYLISLLSEKDMIRQLRLIINP